MYIFFYIHPASEVTLIVFTFGSLSHLTSLLSFNRILTTMLVFVTYPNLELPAVSFTAGAESLVCEVLRAAAGEWDIDVEEVELTFGGDVLCETKRLADYGVIAESEVEMWEKQFRVFGKCWFVDPKRDKLLHWLGNHKEEYLYLDGPTFSENGCLTVGGHQQMPKGFPSEAKRISFCNSNSDITVIPDGFFYGSPITALDLSCLSSVTTIAKDFLCYSTQVTFLDLSGLSSVTTIGNSFLYHCMQITALDLSCLSSVTTIGNAFLSGCSQITSLDLSGLSSVTTIGNSFSSHCSQITSLDLSSLSSVTTIGNSFLSHCLQITSLDLSGLSSVTTIADNFLFLCSQITSLDLSSLSSVTTIGNSFLSHCSQTTSLDLSGLSSESIVELL